jgi:hypothetical protein
VTVTDHLPDETLSALLDQQLEPADLRAANAHVEGCASCAQRLADLRSVVAMLHSLPRVELPRDFALGPRLVADPPNVIRLQRWYTWTRAGAASLAAVFVFLVAGTAYLDTAAPRAAPSTSALLVRNEATAAPTAPAAPAVPQGARDRAADAAQPGAPAAPQQAAPTAAQLAQRAQSASAGEASSAATADAQAAAGPADGAQPATEAPADQIAAATSVRALPTPVPTPAPTSVPAPVAAVTRVSPADPAAPLRAAAGVAGVLAVLALLLALVMRRSLARSRAPNLIQE